MMAIGFVLTPLQISAFGFVVFGLYMLVQGFIYAVMSPVTAAATAAIVKSLSKARASNAAGVEREFSSGVALIAAIGLSLLILATAAAMFAPVILDFPSDLTLQIRVLVGCIAVVITANVVTSPWLALFLIEHRPFAYNSDLAVLRSIELIAFGLAFLIPGGMLFVNFLIARMVLSLVHFAIRIVRASRLVPEARVRIASIDRTLVSHHARLLGLTASQPFANFNFFVIDNYLLNFVFGPVYNGIYAIVTQLRGYARRIGSEAYGGMEAVASNIHESGTRETNILAMLSVVRITSGLMLLCTATVAIFFDPLIDLWLGDRLRNDAGLAAVMPWKEAVDLAWAMLSLLLVGGIFLEVSTAGTRFLFGMGLVKRYAGIMYGAGATKLAAAIGIALWVTMSADGEAPPIESALLFPASTLAIQVVFSGILFPRRLVHVTGIRWGTYLHHAAVRPIAAAVAPTAVGLLFIGLITNWTWGWLILAGAVVGCVTGGSCLVILLTSLERQRVLGLLKRGRANAEA